MDRKIGSARTWHLLRHLPDPDKSTLEAKQQLEKLVYKYEGTTDELIAEVRDRYLSCVGSGSLPEYSGLENPDLDSPITVLSSRFPSPVEKRQMDGQAAFRGSRKHAAACMKNGSRVSQPYYRRTTDASAYPSAGCEASPVAYIAVVSAGVSSRSKPRGVDVPREPHRKSAGSGGEAQSTGRAGMCASHAEVTSISRRPAGRPLAADNKVIKKKKKTYRTQSIKRRRTRGGRRAGAAACTRECDVP
ncbi:hypothetical protein HPB49_023497 [Dermacentor silvarum]|uniref:Uncharacterized protein n=1 Tax=Dermacentor silvarum TaxID=543639 RepID=A0ACB8E3Y3_DERSI|nr:hypothetical protein HPB49_023497 [Dermacentor silvarum]